MYAALPANSVYIAGLENPWDIYRITTPLYMLRGYKWVLQLYSDHLEIDEAMHLCRPGNKTESTLVPLVG